MSGKVLLPLLLGLASALSSCSSKEPSPAEGPTSRAQSPSRVTCDWAEKTPTHRENELASVLPDLRYRCVNTDRCFAAIDAALSAAKIRPTPAIVSEVYLLVMTGQ